MKTSQFVRLAALALPLAGLAATASAQPVYGYDPTYRPQTNSGDRVRGTVSRLYSPRNFDVRLPNGDIVRVKPSYDPDVRIGDRVVAIGDRRGGTLYADTIQFRDNRSNGRWNSGWNNRYQRAELRGEVVSVDGRRSLRVRSFDTNRVFRVEARDDFDGRISRGDEVSVRGVFDGNIVRADYGQVRLLSNDNRRDDRDDRLGDRYDRDNGSYGRRVDFPGTVTAVRERGVEVRGDNGQNYVVRVTGRDLDDLRSGDRVRVQGTTENGFINASRVFRTN